MEYSRAVVRTDSARPALAGFRPRCPQRFGSRIGSSAAGAFLAKRRHRHPLASSKLCSRCIDRRHERCSRTVTSTFLQIVQSMHGDFTPQVFEPGARRKSSRASMRRRYDLRRHRRASRLSNERRAQPHISKNDRVISRTVDQPVSDKSAEAEYEREADVVYQRPTKSAARYKGQAYRRRKQSGHSQTCIGRRGGDRRGRDDAMVVSPE